MLDNLVISDYLLRIDISYTTNYLSMMDDSIQIEGVEYKISGQIGEGGVGRVYCVKAFDQKFALKVIYDYRNPIIKEMVNQQIKTQQLFAGHPHIIQIIASKQQNRKMYIVFELGTCSLRNIMTMQGHVELKEFMDILLDTTKGLMAIHNKNLIHRDIKPENIICVEKTYKITDFGSLQAGTVGEGVIGTPLYLPPEMLFQEEEQYTQKIDVWSLGVSLFEVYFRIHPFFYGSKDISHKELYKQLKENIQKLIPKFSMKKFLTHLADLGLEAKCESIRNKLQITPPEIINQFTLFFQYQKDRPEIQYFVGVFSSLEDIIRDIRPTTSRILKKEEQLPQDFRIYVQTMNMFYELSSRYWTNKFEEVQFHLELAMWYWNYFNYNGSDYIKYKHQTRLNAYRKDRNILWEEVQSSFFDYWIELTSNNELTFYEHLSILKIRILLCGAMYKIYKDLQYFLDKISRQVGMQIGTVVELSNYLKIFQIYQLKKIEDTLINKYYSS